MSEKLYALLLRLYPSQFRKEYGSEALRFFHDRLRDERGFIPRLRLWFDLLTDLCISIPQEYRRAPSAFGSARMQQSTGIPSFYLLESELPRPQMLLFATAFALAGLSSFGVLLSHTGENRFTGGTPFTVPTSSTPQRSLQSLSGNAESDADAVQTPPSSDPQSVLPFHGFALDDRERWKVINEVITTLKKIHANPASVQKIATVLTNQQVNGDFDAVVNGKDFAYLLNWQIPNLCPDIHLTVI
jgi:hypothetical protein